MSTVMPDGGDLRARAVKRLKKKHDFHVHLLMYVMVNGFFVAIWALTGAGFFWPALLIIGWGIGLVANAFDAYGSDQPTEGQISREVARLTKRR